MNFATTKRRILQYIEYKHITTTIFFQKTGIKRGFLDTDKLSGAVSDLFLTKIIAAFQDISLDWLLTGEGEMLKSEMSTKQSEVVAECLLCQSKDKLIVSQEKTISAQEKAIAALESENNILKKGGVYRRVGEGRSAAM